MTQKYQKRIEKSKLSTLKFWNKFEKASVSIQYSHQFITKVYEEAIKKNT